MEAAGGGGGGGAPPSRMVFLLLSVGVSSSLESRLLSRAGVSVTATVMRRRTTRGHLLSILCTLWCAGLMHARTQQTFVVRYKNGEHTVPVTVVLDYKKQTEYVINMSPRATTKTVTLYDFKQKTIAYKDLTNRECFLGRLTYETLNEETDALAKIHNPVERQPKVLSLDPHRTSLTPTEIRNMAGQKTAVFCGKMNTWLVMPREAHHNIQKREVDEIDERTFHRHGYHTVRYSHFGKETRRRYRNPASRRFLQGRTDASNIPNWKAGHSETGSENSAKPLEYPSFEHALNPSRSETAFDGNDPDFHHPEPPLINGEGEFHPAPTFHPASVAENWNTGEAASSAFLPNPSNGQNGGQFSFYPPVIETPNYQDETGGNSNDKGDSREKHIARLEDANIVNGAFASENTTAVSKGNPSHPVPQSVLRNAEMIETKHDPNPQNRTYDFNGDHRQSGVEDETIPFGNDLNASGRKLYPKTSDENAILEDPDVSSNVLEIPKVTKKFENIGNSLQSPPITQPNEDVHDLFEGFFNLRKSDPPSDQLLYNSYFMPSEPNGGRERHYPDDSLISGHSSFSHTKLNNDTDTKQQWSENEPNIPNISDVITPTDLPSLTTNTYSNYNAATISPTYWNGFPDSRTLKSNPENSNTLNPTPQKVSHSSRSRTVELLQPISSKDENTLNKVVENYYTTANPLYTFTDKKYSHHRSDVSGKTKLTETTEDSTSNNFNRNPQETNERQNLFDSRLPEGTSSQQIRFQNVLRNYKPDEIVIDVEKIPTQRPPESTLGFQGQVYSPNNNASPNLSRNINGHKSEQTSGGTWRGRPIRKPNFPNRKTHNLQPGGLSFASRIPKQPRRNESNLFQHRVHDNNIRQLVYPSPPMLPHPLHNTQRSYKLDSLPPGVSIHPRHPNAPYADAVRSNVLVPVPQGRTPKLHHRQRHHKKKDRLGNSCCRTRGETKSCCGSCCRSKSLHNKPSCCSSAKPGKNELRPKQVPTANVPAPQQVRKPAEDPRNRCQKEKLCRTLYESTQQVMVCRHAKIDGC